MTKPSNIPALEKATGRPWDDWLAYFDRIGARDLTHQEIVPKVVDEIAELVEKSHGWWAQGITIAYEQHIGRRVPGQGTDGEFRAGATKTYPGSIPEAAQAWLGTVTGVEEFGGVPLDGEPTTSQTPKRHYWRARLADGSRVSVACEATAPGKTRIAVEHTKLGSAEEIDRWKAVWKELLASTTA